MEETSRKKYKRTIITLHIILNLNKIYIAIDNFLDLAYLSNYLAFMIFMFFILYI